MQTNQTARLAGRIRKIREHRVNGKLTAWRIVCDKLSIRTADGKPDTGMAYKIGYEGKEPAHMDVRRRLGLLDICALCHRPFRKPGLHREISPARQWWNRLKSDERNQWIEKLFQIS